MNVSLPSFLDNFALLTTYSLLDWALYGNVLKILIQLLNRLGKEVLRVCEVDKTVPSFPPLDCSVIVDDRYLILFPSIHNQVKRILSRSAFETLIKYLSDGWLASDGGAILLRSDLSSGLASGRGTYCSHFHILT